MTDGNRTTPYKTNKNTFVKAKHNHKPVAAKGSCPNQAKEVALFPLRYSVDENDFIENDLKTTQTVADWKKIISNQSKHPLDEKWLSKNLPKLNTRNYTLRQLREGWLYVWTAKNKLEEYKIQPAKDINGTPTLTKIDLQSNQNKDERTAAGEAKVLLTFPKNTILYMSYSPVQWTWRICQKMQEKQNHSQWMRQINLNQYPPENTDILANLDQTAADIFSGAPKATFNSSLIVSDAKYQDEEHGKYLISNISSDKILAASKDHTVDLLVALDDPFGIINDLIYSLALIVTAKEGYETANQRKTSVAQLVYPMVGLGIEEFIPEHIAKDPENKFQYLYDMVDLNYLGAHYDSYRDSTDAEYQPTIGGPPPPWGGLNTGNSYAAKVNAQFKERWEKQSPFSPKQTVTITTAPGKSQLVSWNDKLVEWNNLSTLRRHLDLKGALEHLKNREATLKIYNDCIEKNIQDLIQWLNLLTPDADAIFHDTTQLQQSTELYIHAEKIVNLIQEHATGMQWLVQQLKSPSTLFGLSLFNFNLKLYKLFADIATQASNKTINTGGADLKLDNSVAYNIFNRINDTVGGMSNEHLQKLALFEGLDEFTQNTYKLMQKFSITASIGKLYQKLVVEKLYALSALTPKELMPYALIVTIGPSDRLFVYENLRFTDEFKSWTVRVNRLTTRIEALSAQNRELSSSGKVGKESHDANKEQIKQNIAEKNQLKKQLNTELGKKPIAFVATDASVDTYRTSEELFYRESGTTEAADRVWARAQSAAKAKTMASAWVSKFKTGANQVAVNFLPVAAIVWNIYNTKDAINKAKSYSNTIDTLKVISNIGYTGQAVMSLWLGSAFEDYITFAKGVISKTNVLYEKQNINIILKLTLKDLASQNKALATIGEKLLVRVGILNAFVAVAALAEFAYSVPDISKASNLMDQIGQFTKNGSLFVMGGAGLYGVGNAVVALLFDISFAYMSFVVPVLFWAGVVYLLASIWIEFFHREGLALWLDRCIWGIDCESRVEDEKLQLEELKKLYKIILKPAVQLTYTKKYMGFTPGRIILYNNKYTGFWLQLALPVDLKDNHLQIQTLLVKDRMWPLSKQVFDENVQYAMKYLTTNGVWSDPRVEFGKNLSLNPKGPTEQKVAMYDYDADLEVKRYVYTVWIPYETDTSTIMDLNINYPFDFNQPASLLNAPAINDKQELINFSYEVTLNVGVEHKVVQRAEAQCQMVDEGEDDAPGFYINQPQYRPQVQSYTLYVGHPLTERTK